MNIHQTRCLLRVCFDGIFAIDADFFAGVIRTDVEIAKVNAVLCFFKDDLFVEVAGVWIKVLLQIGRIRESRFCCQQEQQTEQKAFRRDHFGPKHAIDLHCRICWLEHRSASGKALT